MATADAERWLTKRCKELNCDWKWIKTGSLPGISPSIKVPKLWKPADLDKAMQFRGEWPDDKKVKEEK